MVTLPVGERVEVERGGEPVGVVVGQGVRVKEVVPDTVRVNDPESVENKDPEGVLVTVEKKKVVGETLGVRVPVLLSEGVREDEKGEEAERVAVGETERL